jgi:hypothetical protein
MSRPLRERELARAVLIVEPHILWRGVEGVSLEPEAPARHRSRIIQATLGPAIGGVGQAPQPATARSPVGTTATCIVGGLRRRIGRVDRRKSGRFPGKVLGIVLGQGDALTLRAVRQDLMTNNVLIGNQL